jgi:transposase InsO family protein
VADITYIAIATGFVYLAAILDAWSRRVVGYAISRSIDARITVAALTAAIRTRQPPKGSIHHSDRGSQYVLGDGSLIRAGARSAVGSHIERASNFLIFSAMAGILRVGLFTSARGSSWMSR